MIMQLLKDIPSCNFPPFRPSLETIAEAWTTQLPVVGMLIDNTVADNLPTPLLTPTHPVDIIAKERAVALINPPIDWARLSIEDPTFVDVVDWGSDVEDENFSMHRYDASPPAQSSSHASIFEDLMAIYADITIPTNSLPMGHSSDFDVLITQQRSFFIDNTDTPEATPWAMDANAVSDGTVVCGAEEGSSSVDVCSMQNFLCPEINASSTLCTASKLKRRKHSPTKTHHAGYRDALFNRFSLKFWELLEVITAKQVASCTPEQQVYITDQQMKAGLWSSCSK